MDIRNYLTVVPKNKPLQPKKPAAPLADSDDDVIECTPKAHKSKNTQSTKPKRKTNILLSSDSEEEKMTKQKQKKSPTNKKETSVNKPSRKEVNIDEILNRPVKQSKVQHVLKETVSKQEEKKAKSPTKKTKDEKNRKKNKKQTELGVHQDRAFEQTLIQLDEEDDDDILLNNMDFLDKTIEDADKMYTNGISDKKHNEKKEKSKNKISPRKRERKSSENEAVPKKRAKIETNDDDMEMDKEFEKREKKKKSIALYMDYLHREGPKNQGLKEYPKGKPNCLNNLTFLKTGVLDSLDSEEFERLVKEHGGRVVHGVSKKVNYILVGEHAGPAKLKKARSYDINEISEDEFLDLILTKSNMPPKYVNGGGMITEMPDYDTIPNMNQNGIKKEEETDSIRPQPSTSYDQPDKIEIKKKAICNNSEKGTNGNVSIKPKKSSSDKKQPEVKDGSRTTAILKGKKEAESGSSTTSLGTSIKPLQECLSWADKYKPLNLKGVIGHQESSSNMYKLKRWLESWYKNRAENKKISNQFSGDGYRAALLSGPPGVGKTTIATLVAKELNFDIVEFNASDTRNKKLLQEEISQMMEMKSVAGFCSENNLNKKRVLLMDEVDGMAGNEDRGGIAELISFIKKANFPIICMCNDREHQKMRTLVNYCYALKFVRPNLQHVKAAMMSICYKEGVRISGEDISQIIVGTGFDIRQTLNHLAMWSVAEKSLSTSTIQKETKNSQKDIVLGPWDVIKKVFNSHENKDMSLIDKSKLFFYDYSLGPLFVQENYLKVSPNYCKGTSKERETDDMIRKSLTADSLSMADVIDAKIRSTNNWSLLDVEAFYCTVFPSCYLSGTLATVDFPAWFGKNSQRNKNLRIINELYSHTRTSISGNRFSIRLDYSEYLYKILLKPLLTHGMDGIRETFDVMKTYNLLREDLTNMADLFMSFYKPNIYNGLDAKIKAALTRLYNKEMTLSFAPAVISKKKRANIEENNDEDAGDDDDYSDKETEDNIDDDKLIKVKTKASTSKATTSRKPAATKKKTSKKAK